MNNILGSSPPSPLNQQLSIDPSPAPVNNSLNTSAMNSQHQNNTNGTVASHTIQSTIASSSPPVVYATILNSNSSGLGPTMTNNVLTNSNTSIVNGGRQQQYHRPLLGGLDETSNHGTLNSHDGKENKSM